MFKSYGEEDSRLFGGNEPEMPSIVVRVFCRGPEGREKKANGQKTEQKEKEQRSRIQPGQKIRQPKIGGSVPYVGIKERVEGQSV